MEINIGKGIVMPVDVEALPPKAMEHVIKIGLRNILMDAHASVTREEHGDNYAEASRAMAEKKLASLLAGEVRAAGTREGDPVRAEAMRQAIKIVKIALAKESKKPGKAHLKDYEPARVRELAATYLDKHEELLVSARAVVAAHREAADDVELDAAE